MWDKNVWVPMRPILQEIIICMVCTAQDIYIPRAEPLHIIIIYHTTNNQETASQQLHTKISIHHQQHNNITVHASNSHQNTCGWAKTATTNSSIINSQQIKTLHMSMTVI